MLSTDTDTSKTQHTHLNAMIRTHNLEPNVELDYDVSVSNSILSTDTLNSNLTLGIFLVSVQEGLIQIDVLSDKKKLSTVIRLFKISTNRGSTLKGSKSVNLAFQQMKKILVSCCPDRKKVRLKFRFRSKKKLFFGKSAQKKSESYCRCHFPLFALPMKN